MPPSLYLESSLPPGAWQPILRGLAAMQTVTQLLGVCVTPASRAPPSSLTPWPGTLLLPSWLRVSFCLLPGCCIPILELQVLRAQSSILSTFPILWWLARWAPCSALPLPTWEPIPNSDSEVQISAPALSQPDLAGSSGTEITLQRLPPWIKGARLLCSHIISQSLAIGCPGESVKFPEWSSFGARGQSSKSHQCKLLAAKYRAGSGHTELVKGIQEAWGGVSESVTDAEYGIQQFYKGSTLTKNQWN